MPFSRSRSPESMTRSTTTWFARNVPSGGASRRRAWSCRGRRGRRWRRCGGRRGRQSALRRGGRASGTGGTAPGRVGRPLSHGCRGRGSRPPRRLLHRPMTVAAVILSATARARWPTRRRPRPPARRPPGGWRATDRRRRPGPRRRRRRGTHRSPGRVRPPAPPRRAGRPDGPRRRARDGRGQRHDRASWSGRPDDLDRPGDVTSLIEAHGADAGRSSSGLPGRAGLAGAAADRAPRGLSGLAPDLMPPTSMSDLVARPAVARRRARRSGGPRRETPLRGPARRTRVRRAGRRPHARVGRRRRRGRRRTSREIRPSALRAGGGDRPQLRSGAAAVTAIAGIRATGTVAGDATDDKGDAERLEATAPRRAGRSTRTIVMTGWASRMIEVMTPAAVAARSR